MRFTRQPKLDLRKSKGDHKDFNAWDDSSRWGQGDETRWFPVDVNPNEDPRYLND